MYLVAFLFSLLLISGCSSRGEQLREKNASTPIQKIIDVAFIEQSDYHCGPAALAMAVNYLGKTTTAEELSKRLYTPGIKGTFQNDLLAATRRLGLIAVPIKNINNLLIEINHQNPVLIFQNLGLSWIPKLHFALVVGYDLKQNEMILHTGKFKNFGLKIPTFESTWKRVKDWGLIIVNPGTIPDTSTELEMVEATSALESIEQLDSAIISYTAILKKWPKSFGALIGLGNIYYQLNNFELSRIHLKEATLLNPSAAGAWYNYALVLIAKKQYAEARIAALKAIETSDPDSAKVFKENLKVLFHF